MARRLEPVWPKQLPELSPEQERIREDWYQLWLHEIESSWKFRAIDRFQYTYPARRPPPPGGRTLEIGAGLGNQIQHEDLRDQTYVATDIRPEMIEAIERDYPNAEAVLLDAQQGLPFPDDEFDRVIAVQVLEHLPDLPPALDEISRVMKPGGRFIVIIPCEGGAAYGLARRISSKPMFEKRYDTDFDWFAKTEHCNVPWEIQHELDKRFSRVSRRFFPLLAPSVNANLLIAMELTGRDRS